MRRPAIARPFRCDFQFASGHHSRCLTDADLVGLANGSEQEDHAERNVWFGDCVSALLDTQTCPFY